MSRLTLSFTTIFRLSFLAVALASCVHPHPGTSGDAATCDGACPDGALAVASRRTAENEDPDAAGDGPAVRLDGAPDLARPGDAPPGDSPPDTALIVPPDVAAPVPDLAVSPPDAAPLMPDAAPVVPDTAPLMPDAAPLMPDTAPLMPDMAPLLPDAAPLVPDTAPLMPDTAPLMPDVMPPGSCPGGAGPTMIKADLGSQPFCIDSSEVTNAQYAAFLAATGDGSQTSGQPATCSWNSSYKPGTDGTPWPYQAGKENRPVVNVDWCDARAYCAWAGKRLCGKIGGGSLVGWAAGAEPTSQWASACTRAWQRYYPYGDTYKASACNTGAPSESAQYIASVKSYPMCEGGYAGLFDMSGNVEEWVDACDKNLGGSDGCASAGASTYLGGLTPAEITCADSFYSTPRNTRYVMLGFRCCADL